MRRCRISLEGTTPKKRWPVTAWFHHRAMTSDSLKGLGLSKREIRGAMLSVGQTDRILGHPQDSCHRVGKYQRMFEECGGNPCAFPGAEQQAASYLARARERWCAGSREEAQEYLGHAFHFIQDALCPQHLHPLAERRLGVSFLSPHFLVEAYMSLAYGWRSDWRLRVREAPVVEIATPQVLCREIEAAADWVYGLTCSYFRHDGQATGDGDIPLWGWDISDRDMGAWMEEASSLVKGATLFVVRSS